jgi:hypothetical protein
MWIDPRTQEHAEIDKRTEQSANQHLKILQPGKSVPREHDLNGNKEQAEQKSKLAKSERDYHTQDVREARDRSSSQIRFRCEADTQPHKE